VDDHGEAEDEFDGVEDIRELVRIAEIRIEQHQKSARNRT
jgi:hypothetical protein